MKTFLMIIILMWGGVNQSFAGNLNPSMTFGDLPVIGVLAGPAANSCFSSDCPTTVYQDINYGAFYSPYDDNYRVYGYGQLSCVGGYCGCPTGSVSIKTNGFDFTQYNGWNGIVSITNFVGVVNKYPVNILCVVPQ